MIATFVYLLFWLDLISRIKNQENNIKNSINQVKMNENSSIFNRINFNNYNTTTNVTSKMVTVTYINYIEDYGAIYLPYLILNFVGITLGITGI